MACTGLPPLFYGSSRFAGERILDFQEEVGCVPKSVGHALDDFDAVALVQIMDKGTPTCRCAG